MEQTSQAHSETPVPETAPSAEATLREELAKWRERVPKLAAALRNRAEEADTLRQELERLRQEGSARDEQPSAGIRARDELIEELQNKLADLAERHKIAQGELHARQLTIDELKADADAWKQKWQSVTRSLDEQAVQVSSHDQRTRALEDENAGLRKRLAEQVAQQQASQRAMDEAVEERDSLRQRNEQLFETTEIANRQIGSLTDSLADLRVSLKGLKVQAQEAESARDAAQREAESLGARVAELESALAESQAARETAEQASATERRASADARARLAELESTHAEAERELASLAEELQLTAGAAAASLAAAADVESRVAEADARRAEADRAREAAEADRESLRAELEAERGEVARLADVVAGAQRTNAEREEERRALSEQIQDLEGRNRHLEEQLGERSALVVTLEQDQTETARRLESLREERDSLVDSLMRAERHAKENADYVVQLDAKLERQKELMDSLEEELAEAKQEAAAARRKVRERSEPKADGGEVAGLKEQVRKLEALVRERTEALNRLKWERDVVSGVAGEPSGATDATPPEGSDGDAKLLLVLNQQLTEERTRNNELREQLQELEATLSRSPRAGDDLTRIHGVGHKLAEQLNELGIYRYEQIAGLDEAELDNEEHALHAHRGRIARDGWIEQAVKLISH